MKDVIVLCAILPFTLAIISFPLHMEMNSHNESFVRETVYSGAQQASRDGYFSTSNIENIKDDIASRLDIEENDIKITFDSTIKYRPENIYYKVEVPVKKVVPANKLFGISNENNKGKIVIENQIKSERLTP